MRQISKIFWNDTLFVSPIGSVLFKNLKVFYCKKVPKLLRQRFFEKYVAYRVKLFKLKIDIPILNRWRCFRSLLIQDHFAPSNLRRSEKNIQFQKRYFKRKHYFVRENSRFQNKLRYCRTRLKASQSVWECIRVNESEWECMREHERVNVFSFQM